MTRGRRIALVMAAAAALALALWWSTDRAPAPGTGIRPLAAGESRGYELVWDGTSQADGSGLPGGAENFAGEVHVAARLIVRGLGRDGDGTRVGYRLEDVATATYAVLGRDALAGVDPTVGELIATVGPDGALRELRPDPAAAPAADLLLRAIVQQSALTLQPGAAWDALEPGPSGLARMRYRRGGAGELVRTRVGYVALAALPGACGDCREELVGSATIALDGAGALRELVDTERLVVVRDGAPRLTVANRFTLRASSRPATARAQPRLDGRPVIAATGAPAVTSDDEARARGWTLGRIGQTVVRYAATGATPGDPTWMHGVAGYLRLHPEACGELVRMFTAPGLPASGRELIASMLSGAGTPEAQTALRAGVDWMAGRYPDDEVVSVLTRVTLLAEPTAATATWLDALRRADDVDAQLTAVATLALGAAIGGLDDPAQADRHAAKLAAELAASDDPTERATLLGAFGNSGRPQDAEVIAARVHDPDAGVRHQVTLAVRKLDDARAVPPLTALAADPERTVRVAAIEMLARRELEATVANRAAVAALAAGADGTEHAALIELLAPHGRDPEAAATLRTLLGAVAAPELIARIRHVLAA